MAPAYIFLRRKTELLEVPVEACTNMLAFSFGHAGWHYFTETLREYDNDETIHFKSTSLYRFYQVYQYEDAFSLFCCEDNDVQFRPPLGIYPWGSFLAKSEYDGGVPKNRLTSHLCGHTEDSLIERLYDNLIDLYRKLRTYGYRPWGYGGRFVGVTVLERRNGQKKFVVLQGNHRTAIMSHLGYETILARHQPLAFNVIRERDVSEWYYVRNGGCSEEDALHYFGLFFRLDGNERALKLGLKKD